jgi:hypothetical protein
VEILNFDQFKEFLLEKIDKSKLPNPVVNIEGFLKKGYPKNDKSPADDDKLKVKKASLPATKLLPSQNTVFLGKALDQAIRGIGGGDLGAIISKDSYIMDGHHRWACTILNDPNLKLGGVKIDLPADELIYVLRAVGDALENPRGTAPKGGDINIFKATIEDLKKCVFDGTHMDPKTYDKDKAVKWFESIGEVELKKRLDFLKSKDPGSEALPREDMPKVKAAQVDMVSKLLKNGAIDIR